MDNRIPVIFDTDIGVDDAHALLLAASSPSINLLGITTCFGNSSVENCTLNALRMCELLKLDIPVAKGASKAMMYARRNYEDPGTLHVHGMDGLGDVGDRLPVPVKKAEETSAVQLMAKLIGESEKKVVLVPVGPLTNIAVFLMTYPELKSKIDGVALMGGAVYGGNALPVGEANIAADPEAAQVVFSSGLKIVMCGLDATNKAFITVDDREMLRLVGGKTGELFYDMQDGYNASRDRGGISIHDAVPVAWLIDPDVIELKPAFVEVDLNGRYTIGCTNADLQLKKGKPNAMVAMDINRERFVELLTAAFKHYSSVEV